MRLYYHTSTLNFADIMNTMSISPAFFYAKRGFGSPHHTSISCEDLFYITLSTKPLAVQLIETDVEQYPLVIQVEVDTKELLYVGEEIYVCDHTLHLDLDTTEFYFPTEESLRIVRTHTLSYFTSKYVNLCDTKGKLHIHNFSSYNAITSLEITETQEITELDIRHIKRDRLLNALKGALLGYALGLKDADYQTYHTKLSRFMDILTNIAVNKVDLSLGDPAFILVLSYICYNPRLFNAHYKSEQIQEYLGQLEGIFSLSKRTAHLLGEMKHLIAGHKESLFNKEEYDMLNDKTLKVLYILLKRYYNLEELALLGSEYLQHSSILLTTFTGAFRGFAASARQDIEYLSPEQNKVLSDFCKKLACAVRQNTF